MTHEEYLRMIYGSAIEVEYGEPVEDYGLIERRRAEAARHCTCECNSGSFCGGCGHAGCGGRRRR